MRMLASTYNFDDTINNLTPMTKRRDILDRCGYSAILRRWLEIVSPERLIVLNYDDIAKAPEDVLSRVYHFLDLYAYPLPSAILRAKVFEGPRRQLPEPIYKLLRDELRPCYENLHPLVEKAFQPWIGRHFSA
jgi:hypothetical protein